MPWDQLLILSFNHFKTSSVRMYINIYIYTLPETKTSHLKIGRAPQGNFIFGFINFEVRDVSFREGISLPKYISPTSLASVEIQLPCHRDNKTQKKGVAMPPNSQFRCFAWVWKNFTHFPPFQKKQVPLGQATPTSWQSFKYSLERDPV